MTWANSSSSSCYFGQPKYSVHFVPYYPSHPFWENDASSNFSRLGSQSAAPQSPRRQRRRREATVFTAPNSEGSSLFAKFEFRFLGGDTPPPDQTGKSLRKIFPSRDGFVKPALKKYELPDV